VAIRHIVLADLSWREKLHQIGQILDHQTVRDVLKMYPIRHFSPSMRLLMYFMRSRWRVGVYVLMRLRESGRHSAGGKKVLRWLGIGR
jgi:hypothetical protein